MFSKFKNKQKYKDKEYEKSLENLFYYKKPKKHKPSLIELAIVGLYFVCSVQLLTASYAHLKIAKKMDIIKAENRNFLENSKQNERIFNHLLKTEHYEESYILINNLLSSKEITNNSIGLNLILNSYLQNESIPEEFKNELDKLLEKYQTLSENQIRDQESEYNACFTYDMMCKKYVDKPNTQWIHQYYKAYNEKNNILKYNAKHSEEYKKWINLSLKDMLNTPTPYELMKYKK